MIDVKKLITSFLILATATSFSALILSSVTPNATGTENQQAAKTADAPPAQIPANAFVLTDHQNNADLTNSHPQNPRHITGSLLQENRPSGNLTLDFISKFSSQVLAHNSEGPQSDNYGNQILNLPTDSVVDQMISAAIADARATAAAKPSPVNIRVINTSSSADIGNYIAATNAILTKVSDGTQLGDSGDNTANSQIIAGAASTFKDAADRVSALPVPQPLVNLHKNLLSLLIDQKKSFETITANYTADPLKALVAVRSGGRALEKNFQNLQTQVRILESSRETSFGKSPAWLSFINSLFGAQKAYAFVVPVTIVHDSSVSSWTRVASLIKKNVGDLAHWIYTGLVRMLVNQLINQFQNQVVNWIQGGGTPKFVTNWKGFLSNSFNQAAGAAIEKVIPGVCSSFGPLIKLNLKSQYANENLINGCRLERIVRDVNDFYNDFSIGGWAAYSESILPSGNYYGSLFVTAQEVDAAAQKAKEASAAEAQAGSGFSGTEACSGDWQDPHGVHYACVNSDGNEIKSPVGANEDCSQYGPGLSRVSIPNGGKCSDGSEPKATTPGAAVGHALFGSLNWKAHQIVSAQRLEELAAALIDASINRIIKTGLRAVNTALTGSGETNGASATGSEIAGTKSGLADLAQNYKEQYRQTVDAYTDWTGTKPQVASLLTQVASACPTLTNSANARLGELGALSTTIQTTLSNAQSSLKQINDIIDQIANAKTSEDLKTLNDTLTSQFDISAAADETTTAQARNERLKDLRDSAQANLPNVCSTPLDQQQT